MSILDTIGLKKHIQKKRRKINYSHSKAGIAYRSNLGLKRHELAKVRKKTLERYKSQLSPKGRTLKSGIKGQEQGGDKPSTKRAYSKANLGKTVIDDFNGEILNKIIKPPKHAEKRPHFGNLKTPTLYQKRQKAEIIKHLYTKHSDTIKLIIQHEKLTRTIVNKKGQRVYKSPAAYIKKYGALPKHIKKLTDLKGTMQLKRDVADALQSISYDTFLSRVKRAGKNPDKLVRLMGDLWEKGGNTDPFYREEGLMGEITRRENGRQILENRGRVIRSSGEGTQRDEKAKEERRLKRLSRVKKK